MGLSCSLAYNGNSIFCYDILYLAKYSSLSSFALDPKSGFSSSPQIIFCEVKIRTRGDGIRTHGGIAPTQPFQDCTINRSDTPL